MKRDFSMNKGNKYEKIYIESEREKMLVRRFIIFKS